MRIIVDSHQRHAKMRAHTATHLLHYALDKLLEGTKQAGSLVESDYLRFDFATKQPLTAQQLHQLESKVNHWITHGLEVHVQEMSFDEAKQSWAKAFFEDKYGDVVRMVSIRDDDLELKSIELCGGTHVNNSKDIWAFMIVDQESVASGIRRIIAVTGPRVALHGQSLRSEIISMSTKLDCQPKQVHEKLDKVLWELQIAKDKFQELKTILVKGEIVKSFTGNGHKLKMWPEQIEVFTLDITETPLKRIDFKDVVQQAKEIMHMHSWIIYNVEWNYAIHAAPDTFSAKAFVAAYKLKWGGSDQLVQGRDPQIIKITKT